MHASNYRLRHLPLGWAAVLLACGIAVSAHADKGVETSSSVDIAPVGNGISRGCRDGGQSVRSGSGRQDPRAGWQRDRRSRGDHLRAQRGRAAVRGCRRRRLHDDLPRQHARDVLHRHARKGTRRCDARHVRRCAKRDAAGCGSGRAGHGARNGARHRALWQPQIVRRTSAGHQTRRRGLCRDASVHGGELQQWRPVHQLAGGCSLLLPERPTRSRGVAGAEQAARADVQAYRRQWTGLLLQADPRDWGATSPRASSKVRNSTVRRLRTARAAA